MEQLIDLLLKFIVSNKTICKDIKETISEISSEDISEDNLLAYYKTIPEESKSLIYACLAKILNLKEYLLYKKIETIAKSWMIIKLDNIIVVSNTGENEVISKSFWVPYVINEKDFDVKIADYKTSNFSGKLYKCLKLIVNPESKIKDTTQHKYDDIKKELIKIARKIDQPALEPYMKMARTETGKTYCEVPNQITKLIYEKWKVLYNDSNDDNFLELFKISYPKKVKGKDTTVTIKDINTFFKAFRIGIDCSGYVNQVYGQWMLDLYTQRKLNSNETKIEMVKTIGPYRDDLKNEINEKDICRDGCGLISEEKIEIIKDNRVVKVVNFSLYHIGYFFPITEIQNNNKSIKIWNRTKANGFKKTGETIDMKTVNETVKSKLKAGDLICFSNTGSGAHFAIVEKTGIDQKGQWYFCITESTEADKKSWIYSEGKREKKPEEWAGVRHDQGYYISIEDFLALRNSQYKFFWFCRPKAIAEYYNSNNIIEYKEEES